MTRALPASTAAYFGSDGAGSRLPRFRPNAGPLPDLLNGAPGSDAASAVRSSGPDGIGSTVNSAQRASNQILLIAVILVGLGVVMVYSSSSVLADTRYADSSFFLVRQIIRAAIGLGIMFILSRLPLRIWQSAARPMILTGLALLVLVLIFGQGKGASRWLPFPLPLERMSLSFQPSEFVKLALVLYLADVMVRHQERMGDWRTGLLPRLLILGGVQVLIVLQPDLGTAVAIGIISMIMLWLGGAGAWHLAAAAGAVVPFAAWSLISSPYQMQRLATFLHGADPRGAGFQVSQSLLALGSGGFLGVGLGDSVQKYFLPEPHTDFVFAFIGEELGLAGSLSVIALFAAIAVHGYRIACEARTYHGFLVAAGITVMISVYAGINVGVVTGILPTTGLPLPLVSYGGSSLLWNLSGIGILAAVARETGKSPSPNSSARGPSRSGSLFRRLRPLRAAQPSPGMPVVASSGVVA